MSASWFFRNQLRVPPFAMCQRLTPTCPYCRGEGWAFDNVCPACDGDGTDHAPHLPREDEEEEGEA